MKQLWYATLISLTLMSAGCATAGSASSAAPASPPPSVPHPPVSARPAPSDAAPSGRPTPVTPVGNAVDPHKVHWISATPARGGRSLDVVWWSGVAPCTVLDRVEVAEHRDTVVVTLYEGRDRRSPDAVCIEIAVQKTTRVDLRSPLGDRKVVDGAR